MDQENILYLEKIITIHENFDPLIIKRLEILDNNIKNHVITLHDLINDFKDFIQFIDKEKEISDFKILRIWIFQNIFRCLNQKIIIPNIDPHIFQHLKNDYLYILEVFIDLHTILPKIDYNINDFTIAVTIFFTIDTNLQQRYHSKYDITSFIINNNIININCEG